MILKKKKIGSKEKYLFENKNCFFSFPPPPLAGASAKNAILFYVLLRKESKKFLSLFVVRPLKKLLFCVPCHVTTFLVQVTL